MFKKLLFIVIFLVVVLYVGVSIAAPAYGTHMPKERHWTCGLEGNFVIDRNLDNEEGGSNSNRYFVNCSYGVFSWFSFDGKIGVGDVDWNRTRGNTDISYSANFAGGYGFRIKGFENEEWGIKSVAGFQHISVHPDAKNQEGNKHEVIIDDWQGSVIVSKDIGGFVSYLGARYGTYDFIKWVDEASRKRIKSEKIYGVILGLDWRLDKRTKVNLEGTFFDGEELAIGISRDF
ncbi:MAG: hypothetical protein QGI05_01400 [Candidatus Omnitrophota bacterium]|nr:hypothetical protein [Candidatus Omnitrophota bacterium]